jgi:hypothetical protein
VRLDIWYTHHWIKTTRSGSCLFCKGNVLLTNILWLDIRVHEVTLVVKILQAKEDLPGDTFDDTRRDALPTVLLYEGEEVGAEWLQGDTYVGRGGDCVGERVEKGDNMGPSRVRRGSVGYLAQQFDFIASRLRISPRRLDDLQCGVTTLPVARNKLADRVKEEERDLHRVLDEPYGGEVTPAEANWRGPTSKKGNKTHPSFLTMEYLPSLNESATFT